MPVWEGIPVGVEGVVEVWRWGSGGGVGEVGGGVSWHEPSSNEPYPYKRTPSLTHMREPARAVAFGCAGGLVGVGWSVWRWGRWGGGDVDGTAASNPNPKFLTSGHLRVQVGFLLEVDRDEVVEALEAAVLSRSHERRLSTLHKGE